MAKAKIALRWKGNGFYVKVPARDLSADEVQKYGGREFLLSLGLYEEIEQPKPKAAKKYTPTEEQWHEEDELWQSQE
jgi:hypothetical protein